MKSSNNLARATKKPNRPLKVGFVFDDSLDKPDGVQQYITTLGSWLDQQGHEVRYLVGETTSHADNPAVYSLSRNFNVRFNRNNLSIPFPANRKRLQAVLLDEAFDVLHVQLPCNPMLGSRIVKLAPPQTRIVGTFHIVGHSWLETTGSKLLGKLQRSTLARFDQFLSVSDAAAEFAKNFAIESSISPNVVDTQKFKYIPAKPSQKFRIVFLGRLVERKGCRYLIEAIRRLRDRGAADDIEVIIGGKGPLEQQLKQLVIDYDLEEYIRFVGFVSEEAKNEFLGSADIAVFPSTGGESFGIVLIEAMASGAGVVMGGDNVGYRTVLGEQKNHLLFTPQNTQLLADKIQLLKDNPALRKQLHQWQQQAVRRYSVDAVGRQIEDIYRAN